MKRKPIDQRQLSLDALYMAPAPAINDDDGCLDIGTLIREALVDALSGAKVAGGGAVDRYTIAAEMSRTTGRDITKNMLDRYCAPGAHDWRFPLEALPALIQATGSYAILDLVAEACGCRVLRGDVAWVAEVGGLMAAQKEIKERLDRYMKVLPSGMADQLIARAQKRTGGE